VLRIDEQFRGWFMKRIAVPRSTAGGRLVVIPAKCSFFEIITSCFAPAAGIDGTVV
jgi:hypothetical protein